MLASSSTAFKAGAAARPGPLFPSRQIASSGRPRYATTASAVAGAQKLMLHVGETTVGVPFTKDQAQQLDAAFQQLLKTFAEKQKAERPRRWDMMEVRFKGDASTGGVDLFEVFCNPNAHATAFEAKLLLTISAGAVSVTTEGRLSAFKADLDNFMATS